MNLLVTAISGGAGLLLSPAIVYFAPRLVRSRVDAERDETDGRILVPLVGPRLARKDPWRPVVLELVTAAIFMALSKHETHLVHLVVVSAFSYWLLAIAWIDLHYRLVLNVMSYSGIVLALPISALALNFGIEGALAGAVAGLLIFAVLQIAGRGALGAGDTKLAVLIGAMRGLPVTLDALVLGMILGGLGAIFQLAVLRRSRKSSIPYAPFLVAGAILSFFLVNN